MTLTFVKGELIYLFFLGGGALTPKLAAYFCACRRGGPEHLPRMVPLVAVPHVLETQRYHTCTAVVPRVSSLATHATDMTLLLQPTALKLDKLVLPW